MNAETQNTNPGSIAEDTKALLDATAPGEAQPFLPNCRKCNDTGRLYLDPKKPKALTACDCAAGTEIQILIMNSVQAGADSETVKLLAKLFPGMPTKELPVVINKFQKEWGSYQVAPGAQAKARPGELNRQAQVQTGCIVLNGGMRMVLGHLTHYEPVGAHGIRFGIQGASRALAHPRDEPGVIWQAPDQANGKKISDDERVVIRNDTIATLDRLFAAVGE